MLELDKGKVAIENIINSNFTINELEKSFNKATNKKYKELIAKSKNIYFKKIPKIIIKKIINFLNDKKYKKIISGLNLFAVLTHQ